MKKKYGKLTLLFLTLILTFNNVYAKECVVGEREYVYCGSGADKVSGIPKIIPEITSFIVTFLQIIIPVVLIIMGMIEMVKAIVAGNPDNVAKSKGKLIKKFIAAIIAFFVVTLSTTAIELIAFNNEKSTFVSCMDCYLNNNCVRDCDTTVTSSGEQKKECGDYYASACPKNDDFGDICKLVGDQCTIVGHNSCSDYPADKCVGEIYSAGTDFKCVLSASGCVQSTIRKNCSSYTPQEGCNGNVDGLGRECYNAHAEETCRLRECKDYPAESCPRNDASGVYACSVVENKCSTIGYAKCASYNQSECSTNTKKDADGNLCTYIYGSCRNVSDSCDSYDPMYCNNVIDSQGRKCKRVTDDHGGNAKCVAE